MSNKPQKSASDEKNSTKAVAVPDKKELKKYTRQEVKEIVLQMDVAGSATIALDKLDNGLFSKWAQGSREEHNEVEKDFQEQATNVMYSFETDTHMALMEGFSERFRSGAREICRQFIMDFDCKTNAEKIMAETAAVASMRYLDASRRLNNCLDVDTYLSSVKTGYMAMLSKERDRAHRQYLSTVATIKQLKAPAIEMNIKANTAFVSQNQQINAPQQGNETNEPK